MKTRKSMTERPKQFEDAAAQYEVIIAGIASAREE